MIRTRYIQLASADCQHLKLEGIALAICVINPPAVCDFFFNPCLGFALRAVLVCKYRYCTGFGSAVPEDGCCHFTVQVVDDNDLEIVLCLCPFTFIVKVCVTDTVSLTGIVRGISKRGSEKVKYLTYFVIKLYGVSSWDNRLIAEFDRLKVCRAANSTNFFGLGAVNSILNRSFTRCSGIC